MQVVEMQRIEFTAARAGVRGQPQQQADLLGLVQPRSTAAASRSCPIAVDIDVGRMQQLADYADRDVTARLGLTRATHALERLASEQPLLVGPAERRPQGPDLQADGRPRGPAAAQASSTPAGPVA